MRADEGGDTHTHSDMNQFRQNANSKSMPSPSILLCTVAVLKALDMELDATAKLGNVRLMAHAKRVLLVLDRRIEAPLDHRSQRYAMIVDAEGLSSVVCA